MTALVHILSKSRTSGQLLPPKGIVNFVKNERGTVNDIYVIGVKDTA